MKCLFEIKEKQRKFIDECNFKTKRFLNSIDKGGLEAILISGSVARGDFSPGKYGGNIDLTVMKNKDSTISPEQIFGKDEEPYIPYHCVSHFGQGFQIAFHDILTIDNFHNLDEAKKYSILESKLYWERSSSFSVLRDQVEASLNKELKEKLSEVLGYINYLLSDYKKSRWRSRNAYVQLHSNLNLAIDLSIKGLYYLNRSFSPAEDRRLYYSYDLKRLPNRFNLVIEQLFRQDINSLDDYLRREKIFNNTILKFLESF